MTRRLNRKKVLVTGGAQELCAAIADRLAAEAPGGHHRLERSRCGNLIGYGLDIAKQVFKCTA